MGRKKSTPKRNIDAAIGTAENISGSHAQPLDDQATKLTQNRDNALLDLVDSDSESERGEEKKENEVKRKRLRKLEEKNEGVEVANNVVSITNETSSVMTLSSSTDSSLVQKLPPLLEVIKCNRKSCKTILKFMLAASEVIPCESCDEEDVIWKYDLSMTNIEIESLTEYKSLQIKNEDAIRQLIKNVNSRLKPRRTKSDPPIINAIQIDVEEILPALQHELLEIHLQTYQQEDSIFSTRIFVQLTSKAYEHLSPYQSTLSRSIPLRKIQTQKRVNDRMLACFIQQAFGTLFQQTCMADLLVVKKKSLKKEMEGEITSKMIYKIVDNAKSHRFEDGSTRDKVGPIPGLVPKLRKYQEAAVEWMLERERGEYSDHCWELSWVAIPISSESITTVVPLYTLREACHAHFRFYNPFNGWLVKDYTVAKESTIGTDAQVYGGILSESMGLGKTVEVLSCILANPKPMSLDSDLQQENLDSKNDQDYRENLTTEHISFDDVDLNGICYCGRTGFAKSALSQVFCRGCFQPMHGLCAGFRSMDEVNASVKKVYKVSGDIESKNGKKRFANICDKGRCPHCALAQYSHGKEIESRATLIVTPPSILSQWEREIKRHTLVKSAGGQGQNDSVSPLKVKVYRGVREICSMSHKEALGGNQRCLLNPMCLSDADIVLTTFPVLMTDLLHSDDNPYIANERAGRKRGRGRRIVPTPLISIKWWRVVLDEAQRVETPTAASAKMALKLISRYRWCVSGTPVGRGKMEDLYGLLLFLGLRPFNEKDWFKHLIKPNFGDVDARISHLLKECLWRSTKANETVRQQMGIPEQIEKKIFLDFSSVEKHFYQRQLEETILAANSVIDRANKARNTKKCDLLSHQLHRLRAACCHPQVGSSGIGKTGTKSASVANGVLSMAQILDRLIDDAKIQAEESQRLFTLNTNAIACLYKLKAESGNRAGSLVDSEEEIALLSKSCSAYFKAIDVADSNSSPSSIVGEAVLTGNSGFQSPHAVIRDGRATLAWTISTDEDSFSMPEVYARFDFSGPTKKITKLAVRYSVAENTETQLLYPKDCILQVQNSAIGGLFVDALPFTLVRPKCEGIESSTDTTLNWQEFESFRPNKSKSWRIYIKSYHDNGPSKQGKVTVSIDVQLMEPDIIPDTLQRMHILHNNIISLTLLKDKSHEVSTEKAEYIKDINMKYEEIEDKTSKMQTEKEILESHYVEAAKALQLSSQVKLDESTSEREKVTNELMRVDRSKYDEYFPWWQDLFGLCHLHPNPKLQASLSESVEGALFDLFNDPSQPFAGRSFPEVDNLDGLNIALSMRIQDNNFYSNVIQNEVYACVRKIQNLSASPSEAEVLSNSHCHKCRSDWDQKGPKCIPCQLEEELIEHQTSVKDTIIHCILQSMFAWLRQNSSKFSPNLSSASGTISIKNLLKKAELFFDLRDTVIKELDSAKSKWRTHLDLLSDIDEMNQCQRSMRLAYEDENLYGLTPHEQAFIVQPYNITRLLHEHTAKQAMAAGSLRKSKELLRYLKNQNLERIRSDSNNTNEVEPCLICLCPFEKERAVLRCGHVYHFSPCLENLLQRCGGHTISCPLRCAIRTKKEEILIASDICKDDGSKISRKIEGQWGTKVDRLVSDLMGVVEIGEKAIVFSQWDDMLKIMEHALTTNSLNYVRPTSVKKFGESMAIFRSNNCHIMLLNFKHGAEGLTLVEANHIFMIEPLLNHSIDSQAINRIHRIGQTSKTYIHRYIINETIETKIDSKRMQRQDHEGEEEEDVIESRQTLKAGGLDGGLDESELQALLS